MRAHQKLLLDPQAYVAYIGRQDRQHTIDALHEQGRETVVRLCFTPSESRAPLRLLGYIAAAQHITRTYLPEAQLQIVAPIHASARINRTRLEATTRTARRVFGAAAEHPALQRARPARMLVGFDKPGERLSPQLGRVAPLTRHRPEAKVLAASARSRQTTYPAYVAAHLVLHDLVDSVVADPMFSLERPDSTSQRIISIGALSERAFYAARMHCRSAPWFETEDMVATGQLFTRHVIPPYAFSSHSSFGQAESQLGTVQEAYCDLQTLTAREEQTIRLQHTDRDLRYLRDFCEYYA